MTEHLKELDALKIIRSLQTMDGSPLNVLKVEGSWAWITCEMCKTVVVRRRVRHLMSGTGRTCSLSCAKNWSNVKHYASPEERSETLRAAHLLRWQKRKKKDLEALRRTGLTVLQVNWPLVTVECQICGRAYDRALSAVLRGFGRTCSKSCARKLAWQLDDGTWRARSSKLMHDLSVGRSPWNKGVPWPKEFRERASVWAKTSGHQWKERGGNGRGLSKAEALVARSLPSTFVYNYPVVLGGRQPGYPTCYKVDFGNPKTKVALEVDGSSHVGRKSQDAKKEKKLRELGWRVCRILNEEVFRLSTTLKLKGVLTSKLRAAR